MKEIQQDQLNEVSFDKGCPVIMPMGFITYAYSKKEYDWMVLASLVCHMVMCVLIAAIGMFGMGFVIGLVIHILTN